MTESSQKPLLSVVVAMNTHRAIGKDNQLLWHISEDLKRFKALTRGHTILMGRKTYESFPRRPLPDRFHIVLSGSVCHDEPMVKTVASIQEALAALPANEESFVIGGGQIYEQLLPYCQKAYITEVQGDFDADTFFPELEKDEWQAVETEDWREDPASGLKFRYVTYIRK